MNNLLVVLLSFYPSVFLYSAIPTSLMKKVNAFSTSSFASFIIHLIILALLFFVVHTVLKKVVSFGYMGGSKRGFVGVSLMTLLIVFVGTIVFYTVLSGATLYKAPLFVQKYLLTEPYTFIAYLLPYIYLFF